MTLRVATRRSSLALRQARHVARLLEDAGAQCELVEISSRGDLHPDQPLGMLGRAAFTRELDLALLRNEADLAVHSLKDLPTTMTGGVVLAAVTEREDPRDALVGRVPLGWRDLPAGARVATSSVRRRAQLLRARPDLVVEAVRGNVDTRLAKLDRPDAWTALVLAAAGLIRLGHESRIGERLPIDLVVPAPGQGALAVTARSEDDRIQALARRACHHDATARSVAAERALLERLGGGCEAPVGGYAAPVGGGPVIRLRGRVLSPDGSACRDGELVGGAGSEAAAEALGTALADRLLAEGGAELVAAARDRSG
jgi:hydroxymethylbilane synthase